MNKLTKENKAYAKALNTTKTLAHLIEYACIKSRERKPLKYSDILEAVENNGRAYRNYYNTTGREFEIDFSYQTYKNILKNKKGANLCRNRNQGTRTEVERTAL